MNEGPFQVFRNPDEPGAWLFTYRNATIGTLYKDGETFPTPAHIVMLLNATVEVFPVAGLVEDRFTPDQARDVRDDAAAWQCIATSPRFQNMTVAAAVAEMRLNGVAR